MGGVAAQMSWAAGAARGLLSRHIRDLRFVFCTEAGGSGGVRDFFNTHYVELKSLNPGLPILARPAVGAAPRLLARYSHGKEKSVDLNGMSAAAIMKTVEGLAEGAPAGRLLAQEMPDILQSASDIIATESDALKECTNRPEMTRAESSRLDMAIELEAMRRLQAERPELLAQVFASADEAAA